MIYLFYFSADEQYNENIKRLQKYMFKISFLITP